jgi:hypothetical protein
MPPDNNTAEYTAPTHRPQYKRQGQVRASLRAVPRPLTGEWMESGASDVQCRVSNLALLAVELALELALGLGLGASAKCTALNGAVTGMGLGVSAAAVREDAERAVAVAEREGGKALGMGNGRSSDITPAAPFSAALTEIEYRSNTFAVGRV